ncbi:MAG: DNA alkylation repair protein [FCB group bacterium]|nr:DNA alkylation repair protein [FCB group bacterium]
MGSSSIDKDNPIGYVRRELLKHSDENTRNGSRRFFRETVKPLGVKSAIVTQIGKDIFRTMVNKSKREIFDLCEELWKTGYLEESFIACHWSYYVHTQYESNDLPVFEEWIDRYIDNWASCDTLCNHTVGTLLKMYPALIPELEIWTRSSNRWKRRAAAVSLIIPARKGLFLQNILRISDQLLTDGDDLVQKGYGWMLKAASEAHRKEIFNYVMEQKAHMPRTALRYAIEKMPPELKKKAMAK